MVTIDSPLQIAMNGLLENKGTIWLNGSQPDNRDEYALILKRTRPNNGTGRYIDLCCGELSPALYNYKDVVEGLDWALAEGANLRIIFHRGSSAEEAGRLLKRNNPDFYSLWKKESENFKLYWSPIRMKQHFLAISGMGVLFEKDEKTKTKRPWWALFISNVGLAAEWKNRFQSYVDTGRLVELQRTGTGHNIQN
jgi:hypothetical protein